MVFSDECRLEAVTERNQYVRRRPSEKFNEACVVKTVKHPPATMIWSCISGDGCGPLFFVEGTMNSRQYCDVLDDVLIPYFNYLRCCEAANMFMQDGAPCHRAECVKNKLSTWKIPILPWPGNSPDLNPIENVWSLLKSKVYTSPNPTLDVLKNNIKNIWENNDEIDEMIRRCIESMPDRIHDVIIAKGGFTKY